MNINWDVFWGACFGSGATFLLNLLYEKNKKHRQSLYNFLFIQEYLSRHINNLKLMLDNIKYEECLEEIKTTVKQLDDLIEGSTTNNNINCSYFHKQITLFIEIQNIPPIQDLIKFDIGAYRLYSNIISLSKTLLSIIEEYNTEIDLIVYKKTNDMSNVSLYRNNILKIQELFIRIDSMLRLLIYHSNNLALELNKMGADYFGQIFVLEYKTDNDTQEIINNTNIPENYYAYSKRNFIKKYTPQIWNIWVFIRHFFILKMKLEVENNDK